MIAQIKIFTYTQIPYNPEAVQSATTGLSADVNAFLATLTPENVLDIRYQMWGGLVCAVTVIYQV